MGATVRIDSNADKLLKEISIKTGRPMQLVLGDAIEEYRRKCFLEDFNRAYATLRANPKKWKEELKERELWDNTTPDKQKKDDKL